MKMVKYKDTRWVLLIKSMKIVKFQGKTHIEVCLIKPLERKKVHRQDRHWGVFNKTLEMGIVHTLDSLLKLHQRSVKCFSELVNQLSVIHLPTALVCFLWSVFIASLKQVLAHKKVPRKCEGNIVSGWTICIIFWIFSMLPEVLLRAYV